jgi:hypothetical protein
MNNYFTKKDIWLDRAYINWHPENVPGLKMIGGRMAQPWTKVAETEMIWDNDVNPEGVAAQYNRKFGDTNVFGSGGAFTVKDNATGFGPEFNNDLRLYYAQLGANLFPGEDFKLTCRRERIPLLQGRSGRTDASPQRRHRSHAERQQLDAVPAVRRLRPARRSRPAVAAVAVRSIRAEPERERSGRRRGPRLPLGLITRFWEIGVNYSYRDVERNAVVGAFTDSDFASGFTASRGSKLQLTYNITKNFQS